MNVKVKNKIAVIEFEDDTKECSHSKIMKEIISLLNAGFKKFIFNFDSVTIAFNSAISGFLIVTISNLIQLGATVIIQNISQYDMDLLEMVGLNNFNDKIKYENIRK